MKPSNHFEAQSAKDGLVEASGELLKTIAVSLTKIANDIRWLGSGAALRPGRDPPAIATQPGSSIMPGKVNPVMSETLIQACVQVIAADTAVTLCGRDSIFELNTMMPTIAYNLLEAIRILTNARARLRRALRDGACRQTRSGARSWSSYPWRCARRWPR